MMRYTTIEGLQDDFNHTIYGTGLVCTVIHYGKCVGTLTYEVVFTGEQLLKFVRLEEEYANQISPENTYLLTAYDW